MAKRHATEAFEELYGIDSPISKRSRLSESLEPENGIHSFEPPPQNVDHGVAVEGNGEKVGNGNGNSNGDNISNADVKEDDEDSRPPMQVSTRQSAPTAGYDDLYLDTIDRSVLDFDFEKLCSISLSNINVYACLVCGKYFQGRGTRSHAYFHALDEEHHVFINLETRRVYVLPEGYEVLGSALDDIRYVADPRYTRKEVAELDRPAAADVDGEDRGAKGTGAELLSRHTSLTLQGKEYTPGFVGMNNIKENDYVNVVVQALAHVAPLRNYLLLEDFSKSAELVRRCSTLVRKMWNPRAFKAHVSPHELLQEVALRSNRRFTLTTQSDPADFLSWFLNNLHLGLGGSKVKPGSSIMQQVFQGRLRVESQAITERSDVNDRMRFEEAAEVKVDVVRFMLLTLDLPPPPLFQDVHDASIIPHIPLSTVMAKYNGRQAQEHQEHRKRYLLLHPVPPYLVLHVKRFTQNKFVSERNPTIVTFDPYEGLDMSPFVDQTDPATAGGPIWYDLVANVVHEAVRAKDTGDRTAGPGSGAGASADERKTWKVQVKDKKGGGWVSCQDLFVGKVQAELLYLGESYLQIWERRKKRGGKGKER